MNSSQARSKGAWTIIYVGAWLTEVFSFLTLGHYSDRKRQYLLEIAQREAEREMGLRE